jgi:hypothetical protein
MPQKKARYQKIPIPGFMGSGGVLLSHTAARAVPSALKSLTSVFGMGTGVTSSPLPPKKMVGNLNQVKAPLL